MTNANGISGRGYPFVQGERIFLAWKALSNAPGESSSYSLAFPFKKLHALIHPPTSSPFCQASDGGLHFGSESGVGAELEKNSAPIASALITCSKVNVTVAANLALEESISSPRSEKKTHTTPGRHIMGPSNGHKASPSHLPQNVKMRVSPHSKEKTESHVKPCKHYPK